MKQAISRGISWITALFVTIACLWLPAGALVSAEEQAITLPTITMQIGVTEVTMDQLKQNHYLVTVPVTIPNNTGFDAFQGAASWNTDQLTVLGARCTGSGLLPMFSYTPEKDMIWMPFLSTGYDGSALCEITFQVSNSVQDGDFLPIQVETQDIFGKDINYTSGQEKGAVAGISGGIQIVDHVVPKMEVRIKNVTVTMQDLEDNDYIVEVPVEAKTNNGFYGAQFGVSWDPEQLVGMSPSGSVPSGLSLLPSVSNASGSGWFQLFADSTYSGSELFTLRFQVPESVYAGATYRIGGKTEIGSIQAAIINNVGQKGELTITGGSIHVNSTPDITVAADGTVTVPEIDVTPEELEANNYEVSVPVSISALSMFSKLEFGISWNGADLTEVECVSDDEKKLRVLSHPEVGGNSDWISVQYQGGGYVYQETKLFTLTFRVRKDAAAGDTFTLTAKDTAADGTEAVIANPAKDTGRLQLQSGKIRVLSTEEKNSAVRVQVDDVTVELETLEYREYQVSVPVRAAKNNGFSSLSFGITWETDGVSVMKAESTYTDELGLQADLATSPDEVWLKFIAIDPDTSYIYSDEKLGTITFQLPETVKAGDAIPVLMRTASAGGLNASVMDSQEKTSVPQLVGGTIHVVDSREPSTTEPPVTTTTTTETVTETAFDTAASVTETTATTQSTVSETETTPTETQTETATMTTETQTQPVTETETETVTETSSVTTSSTSTETSTSETTSVTTTVSVITMTTAEKLSLSQELFHLVEGYTKHVTLRNSGGNLCIWNSANPEIAKVSVGKKPGEAVIQAVAPGITTITVSCGGNIYQCEVTVEAMPQPTIPGDLNLDSSLDLTDLVLLKRYLLQDLPDLQAQSMANCDFNADGVVDARDAWLLLRFIGNIGDAEES